jgi:hypothetical protein
MLWQWPMLAYRHLKPNSKLLKKPRMLPLLPRPLLRKLLRQRRPRRRKRKKALADANQGRIQREEAITERLNQISALAGGEYLSIFFIVCLLILLMVTHNPFCFCLQRKLEYIWRCCSQLMKILSWQR